MEKQTDDLLEGPSNTYIAVDAVNVGFVPLAGFTAQVTSNGYNASGSGDESGGGGELEDPWPRRFLSLSGG